MEWMTIARSYLGVKEIRGPKHNSTIQRWLRELKAWWTDDETPWCGVFVAGVLNECGLPYPKEYYRALSWLNAGRRIERAAVGCVVVFVRQGGGHVGFVVGEDEYGRLMVLGGNQGNQVSIAPFDRSRVRGFVWPDKRTIPFSYSLPLVSSEGKNSSRNEA